MATANNVDLSQNIRDQFLQCKICLDGLKEPKTLPCLHTFCADCIYYYIGHNKIDERKFACPICRRHIYIPKHGVDGFPDSFFVSNLNDMVAQQKEACAEQEIKSDKECGICKFKDSSVEACSLCVECKINLCEECVKSHGTAKITTNHTLLPIQQQSNSSSRENYCRVHKGETIKFYCETCNTCICLPCTFLDHKDHEIVEIKEVRDEFSKDMSGLVVQASDNILQLQSVKEDMNDLENELFVRKESVKSEIRRKVQEVIRKLQDQESSLTMEVDEFYETIAVARDRQKVERTIYRLEHAHDFAKQLLSPETSPIAQLTNRKEAKENLEHSVTYDLPDVMLHAQKLDRFIHFLPGQLDITLGNLLKCTAAGQSNTISETREILPSTKALFIRKLNPSDGVNMGQVMSMAFLPNGNIAILTDLVKKVRIYGQKGQLKYEFGEDEEIQHPSDMVVTRDGEIAITDCGLLCVKLFDQFGTVMGSFGGEDVFALPMSITVDKVGKFIVCDQAKQRVTIHRSIGGELVHAFNIPEVLTPQIVKYHNDKIYVCDPDHNTVHMYSYHRDELQYIAKLSAHGTGDGHFFDCSAMAVDKSGNILITDMTVDKINCFNPRGELSQITASGKQFLGPNCIAISNDGLLAISQRGKYMECVEGEEGEHEEEEVEEVEPSTEVCIYRLLKVDI